MIEKIVDRRAQLAQSHQQILGEIQQAEARPADRRCGIHTG